MAAVKDSLTGAGGYPNEFEIHKITWDYSKDGGTIGDLDLITANKACSVFLEHALIKIETTSGGAMRLEVGKSGAGQLLNQAVASLVADAIKGPTSMTDAYEITTVTCVADVASSLNNKYFLLNAPAGSEQFYVWFNVSAGGTDPEIAGRTGVEVAITADDADTVVATAVRAAIDALTAFSAPAPVGAVITVTNAVMGPCTAASAGDSGFTVARGTAGSYNGVKGVRLAASDKITMSIRDFTATAGKIEFTFKLFN